MKIDFEDVEKAHGTLNVIKPTEAEPLPRYLMELLIYSEEKI